MTASSFPIPRRLLRVEVFEDRRLLAVGDLLLAIGTVDSLDADGDRLVAGAGVFSLTSGALTATLNNPTPEPTDDFGFYSVGISGNVAVVGAPGENAGAQSAGAAYIFDATTGNVLHTLNNPTPEYGDQFGKAVAISGNTVVVGAPWNRVLWGGSIYIFDAGTANLLRTIDDPMESMGGYFGWNVAVSGDIVAAAGSDRVAAFNVSTGQMLWSAPCGSPAFPTNLAACGSAIAVGRPYNGDVVSLFDAASGTLLRQIANPGPAGHEFGGSVALSGDTLVVADMGYSYPDALYAGIAYVFDATTGDLRSTLHPPLTWAWGGSENFGLNVAASGGRAIVASPGHLVTYVYDLSGNLPRPNPTSLTGTSGADTYEFIAAGAEGGLPTLHQLKVTLPGSPTVTYYYDPAAPVSLSINGGAGSDLLYITGGPGTDTATIYRYAVRHTGPGTPGSPGYYSVSGSNFETIGDYGGPEAGQRATFYDGPDSGDVFEARRYFNGLADVWAGWMRSAAGNPNYYHNHAEGYDQVYGLSTSGGVDEAVLYGSDGDDSMRFEPGYTSGTLIVPKAYITRPGQYFIYAQNFKKVTGYAEGGANDQVAFFDTRGNDTFTASPTEARLEGPPGSNILCIAAGDPANTAYRWETVRAYSQTGGYDKAYLTGSTGDDTFAAVGKPRTAYAGLGRLSGTGYFLEVYQFEEVYANLLTGNDTANLYDGAANDYFWAKLGAAVLTDGTLNDTTGDLLTPNTYYYKVYGFDSSLNDHVNAYGTSGGTNTKRVITPLDYLLATYGSWTDAP